MKSILFDCDSTLGIPGKPMDDALALLYLLGRPQEAQVLGITCTFGNGNAHEVYRATKALMQELGRPHIPVLPGADAGENPISDAARFLAETVNRHPGELSLVAIGSLTNLYGAYLLDNAFFEKVKEIVLMGGLHRAPSLPRQTSGGAEFLRKSRSCRLRAEPGQKYLHSHRQQHPASFLSSQGGISGETMLRQSFRSLYRGKMRLPI